MCPLRSLLLCVYYYGTLPYRRWRNRRAAAAHRLPLTVLFYHRIADDQPGQTTTSNRTFARQIRWLTRHVELVSLQEVQRRIRSGRNSRLCASITFDDGYAENCREAIPLLVKQRIPCTYFVTVWNVLEGEPFAHDLAQGHRFPPNSPEQIRAMAAAGIEIGLHGYTHLDFGATDDERVLHREVLAARRRLEDLAERPVRYFSFPFGQRGNLNRRVFQMAAEAGLEGVCSAYGGYNLPGDDAFHLQRIAAEECTIRLKNRVTIDPRKINVPRFEYQLPCPSFAATRTSP